MTVLDADSLAKRIDDDGSPAVIIAEAGSNHDGSLDRARELVDAAAYAGCDAIKFQLFSAEELVRKEHPAVEILRSVEFPRSWTHDLADYAQQRGIAFCASPFDAEAIDMLASAGVPFLKIASPEIHDLPLIRHAASTGLPLVISTGMATVAEAQIALEAAREKGAKDVCMLHCVSLYPTQLEHVNLRMMPDLAAHLSIPVGLSDHSQSKTVPAAAVALGARVIEKHFTLSRDLQGPDHGYAMEPGELAETVSAIREVESALGSPVKQPLYDVEDISLNNKAYVSATDIPAGSEITEAILKVKRVPGGIRPSAADTLIGRVARTAIPADTVITPDMI